MYYSCDTEVCFVDEVCGRSEILVIEEPLYLLEAEAESPPELTLDDEA
jgi:hypothetical protein